MSWTGIDPSHVAPQDKEISPFFRISLNIQDGVTWRISFETCSRRAERDDVIIFYVALQLISPFFRISLSIQDGVTWHISFESSRRAERDDVIIFYVAPQDKEISPFLVQSFFETLQYCDEWRKFTSVSQSVSESVIV